MNLNALVEEACTQLRRREIEGSFQAAKRTAEIMRLLITTQRHADAASLIDDIRNVGTKLQAAKPAGAIVILSVACARARALIITRRLLRARNAVQPPNHPALKKKSWRSATSCGACCTWCARRSSTSTPASIPSSTPQPYRSDSQPMK